MSDAGSTQTSEPPTAQRRRTGRSIAVVVCVVVAVLLTTPALVAYWGQRTLNDTQRYLDTVGPLVHSPEVQDAIATTVTNAIEQQVDIEAVLNEVFAGVITDRPRLQKLVGPLSGAINGLIDREVREFVASDAFADIWVRVNTRAQQALVRLLKGEETGAVSLQGDQVVLDLSDVIDQVKQRLVARGLTIVENVPIPDVDKQIVLLEAPQLEQARTIYAFANPVARWLILVVAALYLAAFWLSRRRPRMTVIIGVALVANALLLAWSLSIGRQLFINELAGTVFGPASSVFYDTLGAYLERGWQVLGWLGLILVVVGWFTGSNTAGSAVRTTLSGGLESVGAQLADGPLGGAGRWVAANARGSGSRWAWLVSSSCCGATTSRCHGCSGRCCWWSCSWRSCRSWSGPATERIVVRAPERESRAPTLHDRRQTQARTLIGRTSHELLLRLVDPSVQGGVDPPPT
jgi:hypothetical protein